MSRSKSTFPEAALRRALCACLLLVACLSSRSALAQACCAGAAAVSPARLMLHEPALLGVRLRAASVVGSFDDARKFHGNPSATHEYDFEQALFGALRVLRRGQVGLVVPLLESWRRSPSTGAEFGAGLGDVAVSARYDFVWAGEHSVVPGVALLLGATLPTGRAPESAQKPLGSDATGVGAARVSAGVAFEQTFSAWLVGFTALVAKRANRDIGGLSSSRALEWELAVSGGYSFQNDVGVAATLSYAFEGNSSIDGRTVPNSDKSLLNVVLAASAPLGGAFRGQAALVASPPLNGAGHNRLADAGASVSLIRSF